MELTWTMVLIAFFGVFAASFMDAIAGGGGIISIPVYMWAGLPVHLALATNKVSASLGLLGSVGRFIRSGYIRWRLAIPSVALSLAGSTLGMRLQLMVPEKYLEYLLLAVLPVVAAVVLRRRALPESPGGISRRRQMVLVLAASALVGVYDGFYGPGTGTFLILLYTGLGRLDVRTASGHAKLVNLASGVGSLLTAMRYGQVFWSLGLIAAAAAFAGQFAGAGLAIRGGARIVRPVVLLALLLLAAKVLSGLL